MSDTNPTTVGSRARGVGAEFGRYGGSIGGMVAEVARARPGDLAKLIALSLLGTALQAGALVGLFLVLKDMTPTLRVDLAGVVGVGPEVHAYTAFCALILMMIAGAWLLLLAQRTAFRLSTEHANRCGAAMLAEYPWTAEPIDLWTIDADTGVPGAMIKRVKSRTTSLERAVRLMVGSPLPTMTFLWSSVFLLWLEPWLTLIVAALILPAIYPVRRIAMTIKDLEQQRKVASNGFFDEAEALIADQPTDPYDAAAMADAALPSMPRLTWHRFLRRRAEAMNKFLGFAALGVGIVGAIVYFRLTYGPDELPVAQLVAYFATLQMNVMAGRQLVSRVTRFARFYRHVRGYREGRGAAWRDTDPAAVKLPGAITGPPAERLVDEANKSAVDPDTAAAVLADTDAWPRIKPADGPIAILGEFPLNTINRFAAVTALDIAGRKFPDAIATTAVIDAAGPTRTDPAAVTAQLEAGQQQGQRFVVVTAAAAATLGDAWPEWVDRLSDRWLAVYHRLDTDHAHQVGRFGEGWAAVLGAGVDSGPALAPAPWAAEHAKALAARVSACAVKSADDAGDDDDDD
ncbi:MAG: hypothetical protein AAGK09_09195 [Planctomycetota bacterium]